MSHVLYLQIILLSLATTKKSAQMYNISGVLFSAHSVDHDIH